MSVSGTTSFTQTRDQLIFDAFALLNVYGIGRTPSAEDFNIAISFLNKMIKFWGTKGLHLWCKEEAVLYFTQYKSQYGFGNSNSINLTPAYSCLRSNVSTTQTTAAYPIGTMAFNIINSGKMNIGDNIGIVQSDNSLFWTTIASVTTTSVILNSGITVATNNATMVYSFPISAILNKPYRIIGARLVNGFDSGATTTVNEIMMNPISHADYQNLPTKSINSSVPNQYNYDPQLDYGVLNLWPRPNNCSYRIHFTYERIIDDMNNPGDNFDFPQEWLEPLTWELAVRLAPAFGKEKKLQVIMPIAKDMLDQLLDFDSEVTGISFQPDRDGGGVY